MGPFEDVPAAPDGNEFPPVCAESTKCSERREPAEPAAPGLAEEVAGKDGDAAATAFLSAAGSLNDGVLPRGGKRRRHCRHRGLRRARQFRRFSRRIGPKGRNQGFESLAQAGAMPGHVGRFLWWCCG